MHQQFKLMRAHKSTSKNNCKAEVHDVLIDNLGSLKNVRGTEINNYHFLVIAKIQWKLKRKE